MRRRPVAPRRGAGTQQNPSEQDEPADAATGSRRSSSRLAGSRLREAIYEGRSARELIHSARVVGPRVHDARVAATCTAHGISELWSADRDFSRFSALCTKNPLTA